MLSDYSCNTNGKWILCGEHAVIRSHPALVFPLKKLQLSLKYTANNEPITAQLANEKNAQPNPILFNLIRRGFELLDLNIQNFCGTFEFSNQLPVSSGLGASAALCVAISNWFIHQQLLSSSEQYIFSKELENIFHSKSSGLDIAGSLCQHGVHFKQGTMTPLKLTWQPLWFLSFSGVTGITSACVKKVEDLNRQSPHKGLQIDAKMAESVRLAYDALSKIHSEQSLDELTIAINLAHECFENWDLINAQLKQHIQHLKKAGAIAAKPTGSGGGGYVLSLWKTPPPAELSQHLISV